MPSLEKRDRFLFSTEEECLTSVPDDPRQTNGAVRRFLSISRRLMPSLPGTTGYFNALGRIYTDNNHVEFAAIEVDDPYLLPIAVEMQHNLAARAIAEMAESGTRLVLANNNHSGLLNGTSPVWGAHENYLVETHPSEFTDLILPFLVTRIYGGAGGVTYPNGAFVAGVRPLRMELTTGGSTTDHRAIHSTSREEHHVGSLPGWYRYHQILGDGHRSHFNLALQFGATALALKAVIYDRKLPAQLRKLGKYPPIGDNWVALLQRLNVLARPGGELAVEPLIIQTQRVFLEAAQRVVDRLGIVEPWVPRLLHDWNEALSAMERNDRRWLAARLDAFAKYELYTNVLQDERVSWQAMVGNLELFRRLALLDHSYHEFCNPRSIFRRLESSALVCHTVEETTDIPQTPESLTLRLTTRARARAAFIRDHQHEPGLVMDWSSVHDLPNQRWRELFNPFAESYGPWQRGGHIHSLPGIL